VSKDNVVKLIQPGILTDRLTEGLRDGARALLTHAVEAEVSEFLAATADLKTDDGCRRVVRHGHLPERQIMTGIGPVAVRQPRVRDREAGADDPARIRFTPAILPPYARRSKSLDTLIPILYLKGVSTGDFAPALAALLGKDAPGLSATTIARLEDVWLDDHKDGRNEEGRRGGVRRLRRDLCRQIREGRRMPEEGPGPAARLLRLPGRTLETPAHVESDRKHLRDRPTQDDPLEGMPLEQDRARHGVQIGRRRAEDLASP
jgi:hypothetical protein